jgi:hypothetical protein
VVLEIGYINFNDGVVRTPPMPGLNIMDPIGSALLLLPAAEALKNRTNFRLQVLAPVDKRSFVASILPVTIRAEPIEGPYPKQKL